MKKYIFGRISGMIIAFMLVYAFSVQVCAAGLEAGAFKKEELISEYCEYISPFYEPEDDFEVALLEEADFSGAPVYKASTREGLLEAIRKALADRVSVFIVNSRYFELQAVFNEIYDHTGNPKYGDYLRWNSSKINCEAKGYQSNMNYYFTSTFHSDSEQEKAVDGKIQQVMDSLELGGKDEYSKIKAIYDYICSNVEYDFDNLEDKSYTLKHSAYAALIQGKAVCQGYATLFYRMCLEAGVDARVIVGKTDTNEPHAWNIVRIGEHYYYIDSTWDAGCDKYQYFLRGGYFEAHYPENEYTTSTFAAKYHIAKRDYVVGQGDIDYRVSDDGYTLFVFGTGNMIDIIGEAQLWDMDVRSVSSIVVEEGVTNIANRAFAGSPIVTAEIADSVVYIGEAAFADCSNLVSLKLGSGVKQIYKEAFKNCTSLESITIPASVTRIEEDAFGGIQGLTIRGYKGTAAEAYAKANNIAFASIVDFNGNGDTGDYEMIIILDTLKGIAALTEEDVQTVKQLADVNADGAFDIRDYNLLYNAVYGK